MQCDTHMKRDFWDPFFYYTSELRIFCKEGVKEEMIGLPSKAQEHFTLMLMHTCEPL